LFYLLVYKIANIDFWKLPIIVCKRRAGLEGEQRPRGSATNVEFYFFIFEK